MSMPDRQSAKIMRDGSLLFASFPAIVLPDVLARHLARMPGVELRDGAMSASDSWIACALGEWDFEVKEQFGEYWFITRDTDTPRGLLLEIASHAEALLREDPATARRRDLRAAWGAAIGGMATFAVASLLGQSPLVRIIAFAIGAGLGSFAPEARKQTARTQQVPES